MASRIRLFIKGKKHGRMMLDSIDNGPLVYPTVEENRQTRPMKYSELTKAQQLQDDCDVQATNIILHGLPPNVYALVNHQEAAKDIWDRVKLLMKGTELSYQERKCRLYNLFDKFAYVQGEDLIECINKAMAFQFVVALRFPPSNNQLRTLSNPINQETIQDAEAQKASQILDEEQLAFLADPGISEALVSQQIIPRNSAFQTKDLDAYDLDWDDLSLAKAVLMANISRLKNNKDAHEVYIEKTIENTDTICGFIKHARTQNPSEPLLESACMFTQHVQELLVYVSQTCLNSPKPSEKLVVVTPMNKDKRVRFSEPVTSSCNIPKQTDSLKTKNSTKPLLTST
nr:hypothetical protein [Tanacetum cinerariifolium]